MVKSIAEIRSWISFGNETFTASYGFVAEVSSLDDRIYSAEAEVQFQC